MLGLDMCVYDDRDPEIKSENFPLEHLKAWKKSFPVITKATILGTPF